MLVIVGMVLVAAVPALSAAENPRILSVVLTPNRVDAGASPVTGEVKLSFAPAADVSIVLRSSNAQAATVPGSIAVRKGQTQATFTVTIGKPAATTTVSITALYSGSTAGGNLIVQVAAAPRVQRIGLNPSAIEPGGKVLAVVYLNAAAPAGGQAVSLSYSPSSAVSGPASVTVPERSSATEFQLTAGTPAAQTPVVVKAAIQQGSATATLTVKGSAPIVPTHAFINPGRLRAGETGTLTVDLSGPAPAGGISVNLTCSAVGALNVPASARVPAGETRTNVSVSVKAADKSGTVRVTATAAGVSVVASVDIVK
jgi:hypothetical protein